MGGSIPPLLLQYVFMAWCSVKKKQGELYFFLLPLKLRNANYKQKQHLTPQTRVFLERLIVTQLVKKFPALLWNLNFHYRVHKSPPLVPVLIQMNRVHSFPP
jgi:hypothetical protein